ncbi:hypothetical protein [Sphingomonas sp.]|uniref:hypothetical protein n=1 Tax=Sphingomonas sp. TaxID=28214 RepID=UPI0035BC5251
MAEISGQSQGLDDFVAGQDDIAERHPPAFLTGCGATRQVYAIGVESKAAKGCCQLEGQIMFVRPCGIVEGLGPRFDQVTIDDDLTAKGVIMCHPVPPPRSRTYRTMRSRPMSDAYLGGRENQVLRRLGA